MDNFQLAIVLMSVTDTQWGGRDAHGRRREFTVEELDALADFGWHMPDLRGFMLGCAKAVSSRWRPRSGPRFEAAGLSPAETK